MISIIIQILIGAFIGSIASKLMETGKQGFWKNAFLGIAGGFVGGRLGSLIGIAGGLMGFVAAVGGACLVIWAVRKLKS